MHKITVENRSEYDYGSKNISQNTLRVLYQVLFVTLKHPSTYNVQLIRLKFNTKYTIKSKKYMHNNSLLERIKDHGKPQVPKGIYIQQCKDERNPELFFVSLLTASFFE